MSRSPHGRYWLPSAMCRPQGLVDDADVLEVGSSSGGAFGGVHDGVPSGQGWGTANRGPYGHTKGVDMDMSSGHLPQPPNASKSRPHQIGHLPVRIRHEVTVHVHRRLDGLMPQPLLDVRERGTSSD